MLHRSLMPSSKRQVPKLSFHLVALIGTLFMIVIQRLRKALPRETARCTRLFGRSTTAREDWLQQPELLQIINHFLRTVSIPYNDTSNTEITTDAILSASATLDIGPGVKAQDLHRDDFIWQHTQTNEDTRNKYEMGQDISVGLLVPGVDTCRKNGATLVKFLSLPSIPPVPTMANAHVT